jgi:hypothetical protein
VLLGCAADVFDYITFLLILKARPGKYRLNALLMRLYRKTPFCFPVSKRIKQRER